jgi:hypothetical protein
VKRKSAKKKGSAEPAKRAKQRADSSHVPLDLQVQREKAAEIVQQVEQEITGEASDNAPVERMGAGITLEPLPKREGQSAQVAKPESAGDSNWESPDTALMEAKARALLQEDSDPKPKSEMKKASAGPVVESFLIGVAGALVTGSLLYLAKTELWLIEAGMIAAFVITAAVSYLYLRAGSR